MPDKREETRRDQEYIYIYTYIYIIYTLGLSHDQGSVDDYD